jgi:hypothetical protein
VAMSGSRTLVSTLAPTAGAPDEPGHRHDQAHAVDHVHGGSESAQHAHPHPHRDPVEPGRPAQGGGEGGWGASGPGMVVLDIGGTVGALVVVVRDELTGCEIEVEEVEATAVDRRVGARRIHTAVRERIMVGGSQYAAVFAAVPAGRWLLSVRGEPARETVEITAGAVAERDWR